MSKHIRLPGLLVGLGSLVCYLNISAFPTGAPPGHTGAEGENDCSSCHFGELAATSPELQLSGLADTVEAGSRQVLELLLSHPDMAVAGIQATVRAVDRNPEAAGLLRSHALISRRAEAKVYLTHSEPVRAESGQVTITIEWDIPADYRGEAIINAAVVAGNDDESAFGDSVLTLEEQIKVVSP